MAALRGSSILSILFAVSTFFPSPVLANERGYSAEVHREQAIFILPIEQKQQWQWNLTSSPADTKEYRWQVVFQNEGREFHVGFYSWTNKTKDQQTGTLSQLVRSGFIGGELKGWSLGSGGLGGVDVEPAGDKLLIVITGEDIVQSYFSSRPQSVTFEVEEVGHTPVEKVVPVTYAN